MPAEVAEIFTILGYATERSKEITDRIGKTNTGIMHKLGAR